MMGIESDFVTVLQSPAARIEYQNIYFKCQQTKTSLINIKIISIHNKKKHLQIHSYC